MGMSASAAHALIPTLRTFTQNSATEAATLEVIAAWAGQYTSTISIAPPNNVLLEIGGSVKLFGGAASLLSAIKQSMTQLGYRAHLACAPTPLAALFFARAALETLITDPAALRPALAKLPLAVLDETPATLEALYGLGLRSLGDCLRLPRDGLSRRFGANLLTTLDRAFGTLPDARESFVPPKRFHSKLELPADVEEAEALLFAVRRLLQELCGYLRAVASGIVGFEVHLAHADRSTTTLRVGLAGASRDERHLSLLLRERFAQVHLHNPVRALSLAANDIRPLTAHNLSFFPDPAQNQEDARQLIERLQARLGTDAVHGLRFMQDHRPERAWRTASPMSNSALVADDAPSTTAPRPLWLLAEPRPIKVLHGELNPAGPLTLRAGPERIESGWWDEAGVKRDYFVASNDQGENFWIYQQRDDTDTWFLHGFFA